MYDCVVIGAGVVGAMCARELAKYQLKVCILEKENDVAMGATKANSAIVHAGFDAEPGTLKALLNVKGSEMMPTVAKELGVKYQNNGSLVIGFSDADKEKIQELYERGCANGVKNLSVLDSEAVHQLEPNLSDNVICALYAPTGSIICPYELTVAAIGNAMDNGVDLKLNFEVTEIKSTNDGYTIFSGNEKVLTRMVINAAGLYSDTIAQMIGDSSFSVSPRKGEYILMDKTCGKLVKHTIFRTPNEMGKGILISPTVDGNLLAGPTSVNIDEKDNKDTSAEGFNQIIMQANENVNGVPFRQTITSFCGLRAVGSTGDFIITSPKNGFVHAAGIESPGLSASPAIAEYIVEIMKKQGYALKEKVDFQPIRKPMHYFKEASEEEKNEIIKKDKRFGRIICRCETVTEGEIIEAIRTNPRPRDLDGVKRRTRAQMGRCQGGFCMPYIVNLLSQELGVTPEEITKSGGDSYIHVGKTKEV